MDEREVTLLEGRVRRSLRSLEDVAVPPLAALRARRHATSWAGRAGAAVVGAVVLVAALAAGDRLAAFRSERAAASPPGNGPAVARLAPDPRYGYLVRAGNDRHAIVDETGREVVAPFAGVLEALTSPDGRSIALWVNTGTAYGLRFFDGATRRLGPLVYQTQEHFVRSNEGIAWASDSSAVVVVTTAEATEGSARPVTANAVAIPVAGTVRRIGAISAYSAAPLGWDVGLRSVYVRVLPATGGPPHLGAFADDGTGAYRSRPVESQPILTDGSSRLVAVAGYPCRPEGCRTIAIHDVATFAPVAQIDLPPIENGQGAMWAVWFRPGSSDVIVQYSRSWTATKAVFALALYPDAGRGPARVLAEMTVEPPPGEKVLAPSALPRADGSAVLFTRPTDTSNVSTTGYLVDARGTRADIAIAAPVAAVILGGAARSTQPPVADRRTAVAAGVTRDEAIALVRGLSSEVRRVDRIEAKLVPWPEFAPAGMGVDRTGGRSPDDFPPSAVWAVAVSGDIVPAYWGGPLGTRFGWALWGINARRLQVSSLKVGDGTWPPGFDALADHPAVALPSPSPSPRPIRFEQLSGAFPGLAPMRSLAASDTDAQHLWATMWTEAAAPGQRPSTVLARSDDGGATWRRVTNAAPNPAWVVAVGRLVLVCDAGADTADRGTTTSGGIWLSQDDGASFEQVTREGVLRLFVGRANGRPLFLADHWWATKGAATGPSRIFASEDGKSWREIGQLPGPASFAQLDVPVVTFSKNTPGDGFVRVDGGDLGSLRLDPVAGFEQAGGRALLAAPDGSLWSLASGDAVPVRRTKDLVTWQDVSAGLGGSVAGLFVLDGQLYAIGSGAYRWDGVALWQPVPLIVSKGDQVFQVGEHVFVHGIDGTLWRSPRP